MAYRESRGSKILLCLTLLVGASSFCHCARLTNLKALDKLRGNSTLHESQSKGIDVRHGRLLMGQNSLQDDKLRGTNATEDFLDVDTDYQEDMGWGEAMQLKGRGDGFSRPNLKPESAAVDRLLKMDPRVECTGDSMKLRVQYGDSTPGSLFFVDRGSDLSPLPLSKLPPNCGYTIGSTPSDLVLDAPYDGCFVALEEDCYVLPLRCLGLPVKMSCPLIRQSSPNPPMVACYAQGMVVKTGWTVSVDKININLIGNWEPLMKASPRCGFSVVEHPEGVVISVRYAPCLEKKEGMYTLELAGEGETKMSCPSLSPAQTEHTRPIDGPKLQTETPGNLSPTTLAPKNQEPLQPDAPKGQFQHPFYPFYHLPKPENPTAAPRPPQPEAPKGQVQHPFYPFYPLPKPENPTAAPRPPQPEAPKGQVQYPFYPFYPLPKPENPIAAPRPPQPDAPKGQVQHPFYPLPVPETPTAAPGPPQPESPKGQVQYPFYPFYLMPKPENPSAAPRPPQPEAPKGQVQYPFYPFYPLPKPENPTAAPRPPQPDAPKGQVQHPFYPLPVPENPTAAPRPPQPEAPKGQVQHPFYPFYPLPKPENPTAAPRPPQPDAPNGQVQQPFNPTPFYTSPKPGGVVPQDPTPVNCPQFCPSGFDYCCPQVSFHHHFHQIIPFGLGSQDATSLYPGPPYLPSGAYAGVGNSLGSAPLPQKPTEAMTMQASITSTSTVLSSPSLQSGNAKRPHLSPPDGNLAPLPDNPSKPTHPQWPIYPYEVPYSLPPNWPYLQQNEELQNLPQLLSPASYNVLSKPQAPDSKPENPVLKYESYNVQPPMQQNVQLLGWDMNNPSGSYFAQYQQQRIGNMLQDAEAQTDDKPTDTSMSQLQLLLSDSKKSTNHGPTMHSDSEPKSYVLLQHGPPGREPNGYSDSPLPFSDLVHDANLFAQNLARQHDHKPQSFKTLQEKPKLLVKGMSNPLPINYMPRPGDIIA
ncbi:ras-associated and pleckstrin homology domains-containing protein 1-like [Anarrhichthys ocellatus]|uniref:ras-associated and pleckstrin homology domains-containing protein 1-like n=1 Tax=Anarrhichthys ocellatus TaxID=433405 RepID=UPI0012EE8B4E|nr:ras-associated and pleckstrin homology domains-containing protein 1-like [Anarrhichthys ocellatus]